MTATEVREARAADAAAIFALMGLLGRPPADPPSPGQAAVLGRHLADPACRILVAERGGRVVGAMSLWFCDRLNHPTPEAWIPDLVVDPGARRAGVASALLAEAERRARERGCHLLRLESGHARAEAHALYRTVGFRDGGVSYLLPLR
jgi:ribosomal protein S18 acetylase RimI-like enzyme